MNLYKYFGFEINRKENFIQGGFMQKILLLFFFIAISAFALEDQCFTVDSAGLVINRGDWSECKHKCADKNCYHNCEGRTRACFWGMPKTGDDYLSEWWKTNSISHNNKSIFCKKLASTMDSIFQNDNPLKVHESPNPLLASIIFWEKYKWCIFLV